jgi:hypothetical protein
MANAETPMTEPEPLGDSLRDADLSFFLLLLLRVHVNHDVGKAHCGAPKWIAMEPMSRIDRQSRLRQINRARQRTFAVPAPTLLTQKPR